MNRLIIHINHTDELKDRSSHKLFFKQIDNMLQDNTNTTLVVASLQCFDNKRPNEQYKVKVYTPHNFEPENECLTGTDFRTRLERIQTQPDIQETLLYVEANLGCPAEPEISPLSKQQILSIAHDYLVLFTETMILIEKLQNVKTIVLDDKQLLDKPLNNIIKRTKTVEDIQRLIGLETYISTKYLSTNDNSTCNLTGLVETASNSDLTDAGIRQAECINNASLHHNISVTTTNRPRQTWFSCLFLCYGHAAHGTIAPAISDVSIELSHASRTKPYVFFRKKSEQIVPNELTLTNRII